MLERAVSKPTLCGNAIEITFLTTASFALLCGLLSLCVSLRLSIAYLNERETQRERRREAQRKPEGFIVVLKGLCGTVIFNAIALYVLHVAILSRPLP